MRVLLVSGGHSKERSISLKSAAAVSKACADLGYKVVEIDMQNCDPSLLESECDVVFPVIHGTFGEDGTLQKFLESNRQPFVGSGSVASAIGFDKSRSKAVWKRYGLEVPIGLTVSDTSGLLERDLPYFERYCCKPSSEGSSIGVQIAGSIQEAAKFVEQLSKEYGKILVEEFVTGRELSVGVLDNFALPIVEIKSTNEFYDFDAKYKRTDTSYVVPADLDQETIRLCESIALEAFQRIGCRHYGRVDVILHPIRGPILLEVNTVPGFTKSSLLPMAADAAGISFNELISKLIGLASNRQ